LELGPYQPQIISAGISPGEGGIGRILSTGLRWQFSKRFPRQAGKALTRSICGGPFERGRGTLEHNLSVTFLPQERAQADQAVEELKADGLIRSTYRDLVAPEDWVEITEAGREALSRGTLDELDRALREISPRLVEIRAGAWAAIRSAQPDAVRQAAHSGRELIDQTLKEGVPDDEVRADPTFASDPSSKSGITRKHRLRVLMRKYRGEVSDSDLAVAEAAINLMLALDNGLISAAHSRLAASRNDVRDALEAAEIALRRVLSAQERAC
jgi:hypothetical protein